jgi:hypothetical protein
MKFPFFNSGKGKDEGKNKISNAGKKQITELDEQLNGWTDNLKQTEQRLKKLSGNVDDMAGAKATPKQEIEFTPVRPHGPIGELTIEPESDDDEGDFTEELEVLKMTKAESEATPSQPIENIENSNLSEEAFKELFTNEEEDENPLANLIRTLPDVTINELEDDIKEVKKIIKDWQKK